MNDFQFYDRADVSKPRRTTDGYLVADVRVARTGIQTYLGAELNRPDLKTVRVYRPEEEVFSDATIASYAYRPITNNHSPEMVTADNWKQYSVGNTGGDVMRDGSFVRVPMVMMDGAAIAAYEEGKRELSMGYTADIEFVDGVTPEGERYDAVQRNIRNNHLALVDKARGGDQLRIGDRHTPSSAATVPVKNEGGLPMADMLKKVVLDGLTIETTEQGEQAINKLNAKIADAESTLEAERAAHKTELADRDSQLAKRDAEIDSLKKQVLTDAELDARVAARTLLVDNARKIHDQDYSGLSDAEVRAAVVRAKFGDAAVTDKSAEYIDARFEIALEDAETQGALDPVRRAMLAGQGAPGKGVVTADSAYAENVEHLKNAWKAQA